MPGDKPILSIAVLTYKHEQFIAETLEGILAQQVNFDFEVVVADDCSPDGTREIIEQYRQQYPDKIRTVYPPHNIGMWENVWNLFNALEGEYFAFVEGDDKWTNEHKLQMQMDFLEANPDYVCCFHSAKVIRETGTNNQLLFTRYPDKPVPQTTGLQDLLKEGNYVPSSGMMLRNVYKGHFPREIADTNVHCDTMMHFLHAGFGKYYYIDEDMSVYRLHAGGVTEKRTSLNRLLTNIYMVERSKEFWKGKFVAEHQRALQKWYYWILNVSIEQGDKAGVKKYLALIEQNKEFDDRYHPNFMRKVKIQTFVPGGEFILRLLGK